MTTVLEATAPVPALLRDAASEHGIDQASLERLARRLTAGLAVDSLMVLRHGAVLYERWWRGNSPGRLHPVFSVTGCFTSTAIGMAAGDGLLDIDEPVLGFFPAYATPAVRANIGEMTLRHLLTMRSGHGPELDAALAEHPDADRVRMFLETPLADEPGAVFADNPANTHLLAAALADRTGGTVAEFLGPRLFAPLGIAPPRWETDGRGLPLGGRGMWLRTADVAALGQLYLDRGRWRGRQLVSADWVRQATAGQVETGRPAEERWRQAYGFQFWRGPHGTFRADGDHGQYAVVQPARGIVVAVTATSERADDILDAIGAFLADVG